MLDLALDQAGVIDPGVEIPRNLARELLGHGVGAPVVGVIRVYGLQQARVHVLPASVLLEVVANRLAVSTQVAHPWLFAPPRIF